MRKPPLELERRLKLVTSSGATYARETVVKIAFATSDMKRVDQHFGVARSFAIYDLSSTTARLTEAVELARQSSNGRPERSRVSTSGRDPTPGEATGPNDDSRDVPEAHIRSHPRDSGHVPTTSGGHEDKLAARIRILNGCIAVYCQAVGASAISQLRAKGIQAVKVAPGSRIRDLIKALQEELVSESGSWLGRAFERQGALDSGRFDRMEQEGWVE